MSTENEDFKFYQKVSKTDPKFVKTRKSGGRAISSIDPQHQTEKVTREWGLYGKGWGIKDGVITTRMIGTTEIMSLSGVFWFPDGEFSYAVSDKSFYVTQGGKDFIDTDIEKKLYTQLKSKCLSLLGFNSDIYLGKFEDANYVNEMWGEHTLIDEVQRSELAKLIQDTETDLKKFNDNYMIDNLSELPIKEFQKAKAMLITKLNKAK